MRVPVLAGAALVLLIAGCSGGSAGDAASSASPSDSTSTSTSPNAAQSSPATTPSSGSDSSDGGGGTLLPSEPMLQQALAQQVSGEQVDLVKVPSGYEAASWDQTGRIRFWSSTGRSTRWQQVGSSHYPYSSYLGDPSATTMGADLTGMRHATFIVRGTFTGDGTGSAVAYADGLRGWGAIKAEPSGRIGPSGAPVGSDQIGLSFDFGFDNGLLVTKDCNPHYAFAECGGPTTIVKQWRWNGTDFTQV